MEYTIPLALQDYMTVIFSALGLVLLTRMINSIDRDLGRMALIGMILIVTGGVFKATGKLVIAAGGPTLDWLYHGLFPLIAPGFTIFVWSLYQVRRHFRDEASLKRPWLVPLVLIALFGAGSIALGAAGGPWRVVLIMQATLANIFMLIMLAVAAWRRDMRGTAVLFMLTLTVVLVMSQMAQIPFSNIGMVWFAQISQTIAQALFVIAAWQYGEVMTSSYRQRLSLQTA
ncbi:MAG: hypothetical protein AB4911_14595 [Oscillochloridaceae bacterium umkhey_bin13]